jgi:hypothetical protein
MQKQGFPFRYKNIENSKFRKIKSGIPKSPN